MNIRGRDFTPPASALTTRRPTLWPLKKALRAAGSVPRMQCAFLKLDDKQNIKNLNGFSAVCGEANLYAVE